MIYYVTSQQEAFECEQYVSCSVEKSLELIGSFTKHIIQFDTELCVLIHILIKHY